MFLQVLLPPLLCSIRRNFGRCELIQIVDIESHVFEGTKGVDPLHGKGLNGNWAGSRIARGKIPINLRHQLNLWMTPSGWRPMQQTKLNVKPAT
jgi:hypothetical protein